MTMSFGTSPRMQLASFRPTAKADFEPFAPASCICCGCCQSNESRARTFLYSFDNRLEYNFPNTPLACCSTEICIVDQAQVAFYDKPPFRTGMAPCPCCCCMVGECWVKMLA